MSFKILLARERGMCAGVDRAIRTVTTALSLYGKDRVYVLHEVVHNRHVVEGLRQDGAVFVEKISEVPDGAVLIFSAHGVGDATEDEAKSRGLKIIDATCPVVTAIHRKVAKASVQGAEVVVIGHRGHQEVEGTIGRYAGDPDLVHVVLTPEDVNNLTLQTDNAVFATQTTLSIDETAKTVAALRERFPTIRGPKRDDTCNATQLRQNAVRELARLCDLVLIAGSKNSSNSNRLREVAEHEGVKALLIDDESEIRLEDLGGVKVLGLSAGASAPEDVVRGIIAFLKKHGGTGPEESGSATPERQFPLPRELSKK
ncbi:MAG: 4-hydroxy-3-methylbut-2-enyl diphosphate reductase [Succinatimonas hippei]|nr:4-hydroxy-3-methylbut-2-enyl diphosphate reductase [Succinatimonas hippei]